MHLSLGLLTLMAASVTAVPGITYDNIYPESYTEFIKPNSPCYPYAETYNNIRVIHDDFKAWYMVCSPLTGKKLSRCFEDFVEAYRQHGSTKGPSPYRVDHRIPQLLKPEKKRINSKPGPSTIINDLNLASKADEKECKNGGKFHTYSETREFYKVLRYGGPLSREEPHSSYFQYRTLMCMPLRPYDSWIKGMFKDRMGDVIKEMLDNLRRCLENKIDMDEIIEAPAVQDVKRLLKMIQDSDTQVGMRR